jgi:hypothetical protein
VPGPGCGTAARLDLMAVLNSMAERLMSPRINIGYSKGPSLSPSIFAR